MGFIRHNPATEPLLIDEEMDIDDIAIQYGHIEKTLNFNTAPQFQPTKH
jgi:hypothetical protein